MILYKYVSFEVGEKILEKNSLGFSKAKYFNDPFDIPRYPEEPTDDATKKLFADIRRLAKSHTWVENTGLLALTRTASNPLMWAHYADQHRGMVIGIDAAAAGLTDEKANLIPAQYGSMIYVSRRSEAPFSTTFKTALSVGTTFEFVPEHYEKLQRLFLNKPLYWSYEEEVRVAKCLAEIPAGGGTTRSGQFNVVRVADRDLHLYSLPTDSIKEIHFGIRANESAKTAVHESYPSIVTYECVLDDAAYSVRSEKFATLDETLNEWRSPDQT